MTFNAKLNGIDVVLTIPDDALQALNAPKELNQKQAAEFCGVSVPTFKKRKVPANENGRWSVEGLRERVKGKTK